MEIVPFELAKKLKEKGFNAEPKYSLGYYDKLGNFMSAKDHWFLDGWIIAPTISQVLRWLRKENKVHIGFGYSPRKKWRYVVMYMDDRFYNKPTLTVDGFIEIEQAALAGIEYVLDNLI